MNRRFSLPLVISLAALASPALAQHTLDPGPSHADAASVLLAPEPFKTYRGYSLIHADLRDQAEFERVLAISGDCWTERPTLELPVDFLVPPGGLDAIRALGVTFDIVVPDMGDVVAAERARLNGPQPRDWYADFKNLQAISDKVDELVALRPDIVSRFNVGPSLENRTIFGFRIESPTSGPAGTLKPVMYIHSTQHAREWLAPMTTMYVAEQLIAGYDTDPAATAFLDKFTVIIVPVVNVDGYVYTWTTQRLWRKNRRSNANGTFGVDLNRNWSFAWGNNNGSSGSGASETYRGTAPFSEPETAVLRDHILSTPGITLAFDIHTYGPLILSPWGYTASPPPILPYFNSLGLLMQSAIASINGLTFTSGQWYSTLYPASGANIDWWYGERNVLNWTIELRGTSFAPPPSQILLSGPEIYAGLLALAHAYCRADYNHDLFMNADDYDDFVVDWIDAQPAADYDRNGFINADDFDAFVVEFEAGC
ncbi:MAG: M14 metallopeptidase family protein [Phycisphaerales bacterium]